MGSSFGEEVQKLMSASEGMAQRQKALEAKYKGAMEAWWGGRPVDTPLEDRKKLHNLVLDLKELEKRLVFHVAQGNIRVFVRVRPINSKEKPHEPEGEPTINFKDDVNIGRAWVLRAQKKPFRPCFRRTTSTF